MSRESTNRKVCHCEQNEAIQKKRYSLNIQYIGKNYSGSQIQPNQPTVQGELEKAISTLINSEGIKKDKNYSTVQPFNPSTRIKTVFSGRTDAGVNAIGQVFHFDTPQPILTSQADVGKDNEKKDSIVASNFLYSLNEILPDDISVSDLKEVYPDFHAQKSAKSRHYRYEFIQRKCKNAFDRDLMRVKFDINLERMQTALNYLLGEHDFSSFKSSGTLNPNVVCFIKVAEVSRSGDKIIVNIIGNRFLYNMVRTIIGTLLEIEGHNLQPEHMKKVLEAKDRECAGKTVSPYGLTLMKVEY